jgi:AraC family transcriptional activator of pobA
MAAGSRSKIRQSYRKCTTRMRNALVGPTSVRNYPRQFKISIMEKSLKQPVLPDDESFFFNISPVGNISGEAIRHPHYQIVWIVRGSGYFSIDLEKFEIRDNTIFTIPPGRFHQFISTGGLSGHVLSFNIDFLHLAIEGPGRPFFMEIDTDLKGVNSYLLAKDSPALQNLLADIVREFGAHQALRLEILSGLFKVFLGYIKRLSVAVLQEDANCPQTRLVNRFYAKLDNQFKTMKQVADYASELFVSPSYLTDVVKKVTGHSAGYHIRQRTIQEAKRLVMYKDADLKMVAYALGFDDLAHFSKYFKNGAGMNFSDFKKRTFSRHIIK